MTTDLSFKGGGEGWHLGKALHKLFQLCDIGQTASPLCASVSSSVSSVKRVMGAIPALVRPSMGSCYKTQSLEYQHTEQACHVTTFPQESSFVCVLLCHHGRLCGAHVRNWGAISVSLHKHSSCYVAKDDLALLPCLPPPNKCWDFRCEQ